MTSSLLHNWPAGAETVGDKAHDETDETIVHGIHHANAVSVEDAEDRFDRLLDKAQAHPVAITKQDKPVAVVLSVEAYENLQRIDDGYWIARAELAEAEGDWLGVEESEAFTQELLNAKD